MPRFRSEVPKGLFRVPISLTKEMDAWLQELSTKMKVSGGYRLPKSYVVRALIEAARRLTVDITGVKNEKELTERFLDGIRKFKR